MYTLITGASRGLGAAFARHLAATGRPLILVARDLERLEALRAEIATHPAADIQLIRMDLTQPDAAQALHDTCRRQGWTVSQLINNAGFGRFGDFLAHPVSDYDHMIRLNATLPVELTHRFLPELVLQPGASLINVASMAGFQPTPYLAVYGATKAFVIAFSQALAAEYAGAGLRVLTLCPGATRTEFFHAAGQGELLTSASMALQSADAVVDCALAALNQGAGLVVPGWKNRLMAGMVKWVPQRWSLPLSARVMRRWLTPP